jgi:hypothetical protein
MVILYAVFLLPLYSCSSVRVDMEGKYKPAGTVTADFKTSVNARSVYNMAFSVWCVSGLPQGIDKISHEIMIWTMNKGMKPAGKKYSDTVIDGKNYTVYVKPGHSDNSGGSNHRWTYIAFEAEQDITSGPFPLSRFLDYLISQNLFISTAAENV